MGHHFSSELVKDKPELNLSDLYVFPSDRPGHTAFVMCTNPKSKPDSVDSLHEAGLYSFHIANDRELGAGLTYTFKREGAGLRVGVVPVAIPELGDIGSLIAVVPFYETTTMSTGVKIWAGVSRDPFAGNALGLRAFKEAATKGHFAPDSFNNKHDYFETMLTTSIVFEIPNSELPPMIHYSGSSAWYHGDHWHRVNRIGHTLLPHLYYVEEEHRRSQDGLGHTTDAQRRQIAAEVIAHYAALAGVQKDPKAYGEALALRLLPDMVPYVVGTLAAYAVDGPNGRSLTDPAMDTALHWLVGTPLSAQVPSHATLAHFPYIVKA